MMKRRFYKRSWQKFHEIQESFRENVHRLRSSDTWRNKNVEKANGAFNQHAPESVLYESDPCLYNGKLSPEIIFQRSDTRSQTEMYKDVIEDVIVARSSTIEGPRASSRECHDEPNLLMCDFNIESRDDFASLEKYYPKSDTAIVDNPLDLTDSSISSCMTSPSLNNLLNSDENDEMYDRQSSADALEEMTHRRISQSVTFPLNLKSRWRENSVQGAVNFDKRHNDEGQSLKGNSDQQNNHDTSGIMDNCYSLDKTFSMNDDLMREMDNYLEQQSLTAIANQSIVETTCKLQEKYISESATFHKIEKQSQFTDYVGQLSSDELAKLSVESIKDHENLRNDKNKIRKGMSNTHNKKFDIVLEKIGERVTANWSEFRKMFTNLQRVMKKIRSEDSERSASLFSKVFPYSTLSSSDKSSTQLPFIGERHEFKKNEEETKAIELEVEKLRQSEIGAEIKDSLPEKNQVEKDSLDPSSGRAHWDNISESTLTSTVFNYGHNNSLQNVEYHQDKDQMSQNSAVLQNSHVSLQRNICHALITWVIALCIWFKRKLLLLDSSYKKLREMIIPSLSMETPRTKKFNDLIATLRFENVKTLRLLSKKVTRLSMDFVQIRTSTEATLKALIIEVNGVREVSRKMTEDNITLMQELKKLHETLEEVRSKFSQPVSLFPSRPSSFSPFRSPSHPLPPPPPPPPPPPLPPAPLSSLILPPPPSLLPKMHTSEEAASIPPPPPLPSTSLQSSKSSTQLPTTPNSSKSIKSRTPRKYSTPLFNRPNITVEDLLKVTLKKAPQSVKDNRRNTIPGPRGPVVSLEMLRNVKLKSAKRKSGDQTPGRSPRSGRIVKNRTASSVSLSPILTGSDGNLERILRQVNLTRPRRLLSGSSNFRERDFAKEMQSQSLQALTHSRSQSALE